MKKTLLMTSLLGALLSVPAYAEIPVPPGIGMVAADDGAEDCPLTETGQFTITFNGNEDDATRIQSTFDKKMDEAKKVITQAGFEKSKLASMNYTINDRGGVNYRYNNDGSNGAYYYNATLVFTVTPANKATALLADLNKKGYHASINVNAYANRGNCPKKR